MLCGVQAPKIAAQHAISARPRTKVGDRCQRLADAADVQPLASQRCGQVWPGGLTVHPVKHATGSIVYDEIQDVDAKVVGNGRQLL